MGKAELRIEIDEALLEEAKAAGIDVEALTEKALRAALRERTSGQRASRWAEENAEVLRDHEERVARHGAFGDDLRTW